ncbi:hypothetical protein EK904_012181, partial [Melospiza melodia maxima]
MVFCYNEQPVETQQSPVEKPKTEFIATAESSQKRVPIQKTVRNKKFLKHNTTNKAGSLLMGLSIFILQNANVAVASLYPPICAGLTGGRSEIRVFGVDSDPAGLLFEQRKK